MVKNILCWKTNRARGPCNEIRIIELILSLVCLCLSFHFVFTGIMSIPIFLAMFCMTGIVFIVIVDIIVITAWFPIGWRAWILISLTSALYFFACTGLSFTIEHEIFFLGTVFYLITAIVFLMDALCIICLVRKSEDVSRRPCPTACKSAQIVPMNRPPDLHAEPIRVRPETQDTSQQTLPPASCRSPEVKCHRWQGPAVTYGGTFHMSKDTTPMPGPEPVNKPTIPDHEIIDTIDIEEETSRKVRTVALMTRIVPRRQAQEVDLTPLKSPFATEELSPKRPTKKLRRTQFMACRIRQDSATSNSPRSAHLYDSDRSSPRSNQQFVTRNKI